MIQRSSSFLFHYIGTRAILFIPGLFFAFLFGVGIIDKGACGFDWCRFLNSKIFVTLDPEEAYYGTYLMHFIYASNSALALVRATTINVLITLIFISRRPSRRELILLSIACAIPGKEFFLLLGVFLIARGLKNFCLLKILKGCAIISLARPEYIFLLAFAWLVLRLGRFQIFILLAAFAITFSIFGAHQITHSALEQQSSLPFAAGLRSLFSGYSLPAALGKTTLYFTYLCVLPVFDLSRVLLVRNEGYVILFYAISISSWIFAISGNNLKANIKIIFFTSILVGIVSPFVHIRWAIPLLCFISLIKNNQSRYFNANFQKYCFLCKRRYKIHGQFSSL